MTFGASDRMRTDAPPPLTRRLRPWSATRRCTGSGEAGAVMTVTIIAMAYRNAAAPAPLGGATKSPCPSSPAHGLLRVSSVKRRQRLAASEHS